LGPQEADALGEAQETDEEELGDEMLSPQELKILRASSKAAKTTHEVGKRLGIAVATSPEPSTLEAAMELEKSLKLVDDCSRCTDDLIGSLESPYEAEELLEAVDSFVPSVEAMAKMALEVGKDLDEMPALQLDLEVATEEIRVTAKEMLN